ncbi:MAG: hypothetical protein AAGA42_12590 [Actinomycetota bacterium]
MNIDDDLDRRLWHTARELRAVPIEPPPPPRRQRSGGIGISAVLATCAVLLALTGGIVVWNDVQPTDSATADDAAAADDFEVDVERSATPSSVDTAAPALDPYVEVAMISRVAAVHEQAPAQRPLPPGVT